MIIPIIIKAVAEFPRFLAGRSGMVSSGAPGAPLADSGTFDVVLGICLGGFFGLLSGFILSGIARAMLPFARNISGPKCALIGSVLGAIICACLALNYELD